MPGRFAGGPDDDERKDAQSVIAIEGGAGKGEPSRDGTGRDSESDLARSLDRGRMDV